jgi:predicted secreted protein
MSNIAIQGAATGTGVFTLASPATNTDRTLVLPDEAGTVLTSAGVPASAMPAGSVLQVVSTSYNTPVSITSTSWTSTGVSASITPSSASSKILVIVNLNAETYQLGSSGGVKWEGQITRNGTQILYKRHDSYASAATNGYYSFSVDGSLVRLDSPATTSAVTYNVNGQITDTTNGFTLRLQDGSSDSTITLMEIAA